MEYETLKISKVTKLSWFEKLWQRFCRWVVKIFYRQFEVSGLENLPEDRGIVLCANHVNSLADPLVIQAATQKAIRPLARSGLFDNPLLRPVLQHIGAVPIYRRDDPGVDISRNTDSFEKCYGLLEKGETLIIFPEGQSHDDSKLSVLKTGAARLALGTIKMAGVEPAVIPVGLTFPQKGQFRSAALVQFGKPIELTFPASFSDELKANELTERIRLGMTSLTLNAESWEEIHLVNRIERFFALRHGRYHRRNLQQRFRAQQRIIDAQKLLRNYEPDRVRALIIQLKHFERICHYCGVKDYQLSIDYKPTMIVLYVLRMVGMVMVAFPITLWAIVNSYIPYQMTKYLTRHFAKGTNQYDTAQMVLGLVCFSSVWGLQIYLIFQYFGWQWMLTYIVTLIISIAVLLMVRGEKQRIIENIRVFVLFLRKRDLKNYLQKKRRALEKELAKMVRIANRLSNH